MTQMGWRLWPYVAPADFPAYHVEWRIRIKPVVFPAVAFFGSIALIWWRPEGVPATPVWSNLIVQIAVYVLTAALWGRWQAQTHFARLAGGSLDPMYVRVMSTHWVRAALVTANGLLVLWMMIMHLSAISPARARL